jgi:IS4 transposase
MKNAHILDLYSDYLIAAFRFRTAVDMSEMLDGAISHDQISRFLGQRLFTQKDYWKCVKPLVRRVEHPDGLIKIDDTHGDKTHSTENDIICWHHDHSKKGRDKNVKGINLINFLYQSPLAELDYFSIPVAFEILEKTEAYFDKKSGKVKKRSPVSKHQLVRERLRILQKLNKLQFKYVLWDKWFSSNENFKFVHYGLKKYFIAAFKANRRVALSWEDKLAGKFLRVDELNVHKNQAMPVWIKGLDFPVRLTKQVFQNKDGSQGELYIVTNDLELSPNVISTTYENRWGVEVFHKSLKQNVGLEKSPTKNEVTQSNHVFAVMIAWTKLELLRCKEQTNHFALKKRLYAKALKTVFEELQRLKQFQRKLEQAPTRFSPLLG